MPYLYEVVGRDEAAKVAWPHSPQQRRRLAADLAATMAPALERIGRMTGQSTAMPTGLLDDFLDVYARRPLAENKGGSGLNDSL